MKSSGLGTLNMKSRVRELFLQSGTSLTIATQEVISRFDHEEPRVYLIDKGTVTLQLSDQVSNQLTVSHLIPGELFGMLDRKMSEGVNQIQLSACAKSECTVIEVKRSQLLAIARKDPEVLLAVSSDLSNRFSEVILKVGQLAFYDVKGRVSSALLELCQLPDAVNHPEGFMVRSTRSEIAMMVGCTREMVGRVMQDLNDKGLISVLGRRTLIRHDIRAD
jgi:CRP/FNR family cyclic AMP-dependent transcriptional regulator